MTDADRQHLARILGMLGSDHAGERAAAGLQAEALRKKCDVTWDELVSGKTITVYVDRPVYVDHYRDRVVYVGLLSLLHSNQKIDRGVAIVLGAIPLIMILATWGSTIRQAFGY